MLGILLPLVLSASSALSSGSKLTGCYFRTQTATFARFGQFFVDNTHFIRTLECMGCYLAAGLGKSLLQSVLAVYHDRPTSLTSCSATWTSAMRPTAEARSYCVLPINLSVGNCAGHQHLFDKINASVDDFATTCRH